VKAFDRARKLLEDAEAQTMGMDKLDRMHAQIALADGWRKLAETQQRLGIADPVPVPEPAQPSKAPYPRVVDAPQPRRTR
jgi:hypothetical protein